MCVCGRRNGPLSIYKRTGRICVRSVYKQTFASSGCDLSGPHTSREETNRAGISPILQLEFWSATSVQGTRLSAAVKVRQRRHGVVFVALISVYFCVLYACVCVCLCVYVRVLSVCSILPVSLILPLYSPSSSLGIAA